MSKTVTKSEDEIEPSRVEKFFSRKVTIPISLLIIVFGLGFQIGFAVAMASR